MKSAILVLLSGLTVCYPAGNDTNPQKGKRSFDFLKAEWKIAGEVGDQFAKCPFDKAPPAPGKAASLKEQLDSNRRYVVALDQYLAGAIQEIEKAENVLNDAQERLSRMDSAGVDESVVALTLITERFFGDTAHALISIKGLARQASEDLHRSDNQAVAAHLVNAIFDGAILANPGVGVASFLKGLSEDEKKELQQREALQSHLRDLQKLAATIEHDKAEFVTRRSEMLTACRARYPEFQWDFILPAAQTK